MQEQAARKNYIGLVSDASEDKRRADSVARSQPRVMSYLAARLAAALGYKDAPGVRPGPGRTTSSNPPESGDETLSG